VVLNVQHWQRLCQLARHLIISLQAVYMTTHDHLLALIQIRVGATLKCTRCRHRQHDIVVFTCCQWMTTATQHIITYGDIIHFISPNCGSERTYRHTEIFTTNTNIRRESPHRGR